MKSILSTSRRELFKVFGLGALFLKGIGASAEEQENLEPEPGYVFFTPDEVEFLKSFVDVLIPADKLSPSASQCGVVYFVDRQLAGEYGAAGRVYTSGPFYKGSPSQGYQKPFSPSQIYRVTIKEINNHTIRKHRKPFDLLTNRQKKNLVDQIFENKSGIKSETLGDFKSLVYKNTMEGFFADPVYLGNRKKSSWKMIGYPGILAFYSRAIEQFKGKKYKAQIMGIEDLD